MEHEEILELLSTHGIRITHDKRSAWMSHDDNETWVVCKKIYRGEKPAIIYCGYSFRDAFRTLING
jgi:hypothetical protein